MRRSILSNNLVWICVAFLAAVAGAVWHVSSCFMEAHIAANVLCKIRDRARPYGASEGVDDHAMVALLEDCAWDEFVCRLSVSGDDYAEMVECETRGDVDIAACEQPESGRAAAAAVRCRDGMPKACRERALVNPTEFVCPQLPPLRTE